ncbi:MAG: bifunctional riboflavin kinase/FAD synthetase [Limnochordia bacterium]|jgi:riboflavin kinase/FMN adenylyltransferase|nr:bifunctional riboflavin kinase/FAD synthetase [Limnochordia bacterium]
MGLNWINRQDSPARSVALGTFDGVHRGHQKLLEKTIALTPRGGTSSVLTFDIPPEQYFRGDLRLVSTFQRRVGLFRSFGIDEVAWLRFGPELTSMEAEYFVEKILADEIRAKEVICGYDYRFGKGRLGDVAFLQKQGERYGFSVTVIPAVQGEGGHTISSSAIRQLLRQGDVTQATEYLGYYPTYQVTVEQASGGSGFRVRFDSALVLPIEGVYLISCFLASGQGMAAIAWPQTTGQMNAVFLGEHPPHTGDQEVLEVQFLSRLRGGKPSAATESDVLKAHELLPGFHLQDARFVLK